MTPEIAKKLLETVDAGLISGVGNPIPGEMCVEAAVCYAFQILIDMKAPGCKWLYLTEAA